MPEHDDLDNFEGFPWISVLICAVIIAVVLVVALSSGFCTTSTPC